MEIVQINTFPTVETVGYGLNRGTAHKSRKLTRLQRLKTWAMFEIDDFKKMDWYNLKQKNHSEE